MCPPSIVASTRVSNESVLIPWRSSAFKILRAVSESANAILADSSLSELSLSIVFPSRDQRDSEQKSAYIPKNIKLYRIRVELSQDYLRESCGIMCVGPLKFIYDSDNVEI